MQFLLHFCHSSCCFCYKLGDKSGMRKGQYCDFDKLNIFVVICDTDIPYPSIKSWWHREIFILYTLVSVSLAQAALQRLKYVLPCPSRLHWNLHGLIEFLLFYEDILKKCPQTWRMDTIHICSGKITRRHLFFIFNEID